MVLPYPGGGGVGQAVGYFVVGAEGAEEQNGGFPKARSVFSCRGRDPLGNWVTGN